jgi:hypothetical protein
MDAAKEEDGVDVDAAKNSGETAAASRRKREPRSAKWRQIPYRRTRLRYSRPAEAERAELTWASVAYWEWSETRWMYRRGTLTDSAAKPRRA